MLMTYGASNVALFRRAVYFVDRILKGTGAEDLPDEQPTTIEPAPRCSSRLRRVLDASYDRALWALPTWLDSWPGIGHVAVGMYRQGFDL